MEHAAIQLTSGFKISWDIDDVLKKFVDIGPPVLDNALWTVDKEERPHWQFLPQRVAISRFFYKNFQAECQEVAEHLIKLQASMQHKRNTHPLIAEFLDHKIVSTRVDLVHLIPGEDVYPHRDERKFTINIGLKNSNSCITMISDSENTKENEFFEHPNYAFTMQDGDVYVLQVKNVHAVQSKVIKDSKIIRYLISYTM